MFALTGSSSTWRTPRGEQAVVLVSAANEPVHSAGVGAPLWMNVNVCPPSVDLYRPHLPASGAGRVTPEQHTLDMPRKAVVVATYRVLRSPGLTTISPMPLPPSASRPSGPLQVRPPLVDLYRPTPATQPEPQMLASPVPT